MVLTTENLKNPSVPTITNPVDLDAAIQRIQVDLDTKIPWLEKSFGRARAHPSTVGNDTIRIEPKVYQNNGEYYPVLPNDALRSYSFFRLSNDRRPEDYSPNTPTLYEVTRTDLIVWGNLQSIDRTKDYVFTDELINDVRQVLNFSPDVTIVRLWDERPEQVFRGYRLDPNHRDLLMYPYFAFRFEFDLRYNITCP
jgi:hypothetical protein